MALRLVSLGCVLVLVAGCAGRMDSQGALPPVSSSTHRATGGALVLHVRVPKQRARAHYVAPSTKGLSVDINGPTDVKEAVGIDVGARGCVSTLMTIDCALVVPSLTNCSTTANCYTATVATYDKFDAADNKIPPGAHKLSADVNFGFSIQGGNTHVPLILWGVPKKVALVPSGDAVLTGSDKNGFTWPKCATSEQRVALIGVDADGNYIMGPGAPAITLTSDNTAQVGIKKPTAASPNTFTLSQPKSPAYPYGGLKVHLTAKATPPTSSGAAAVTSTIALSYSGDICGKFTEFAIPTSGSAPLGITNGPDGNMWFTEGAADKIGRITTTGTITEFPVPTAAAMPYGITNGPDGNIWFVEDGTSKIGKMSTSGAAVEYATPTAGAVPVNIVTGSDGNLWFTENGADKIGRITTGGIATEFAIPTAGSAPYGIAAGSDGNLWFAEISGDKIGQVTVAGVITEFAVPTTASRPTDITAGPDANLWFAECGSSKIGRITPTGSVESEYPTPDLVSVLPAFVTTGPDGAVWFSEAGVNKIGRVTTGGAFTEYAIPTSGATPFHLTTGPDGAIWFVEESGNKVARLI